MKRILLAGLVLLATNAGAAAAQTVFGPQLSWGDDSDLGIGARLELPLAGMMSTDPSSPASKLRLVGSFDWFFPDDGVGIDVDWWEINANLTYPIEAEGVRPYVGGGLNFAHVSVHFDDALLDDVSDTDVGLNLLGGLKFLLGTLDAFAEARFALGGADQFVLTSGILFGGH